MPLTTETALRKDRNTGVANMEHRHFATVAAIIADMDDGTMSRDDVRCVAEHFARKLADTNPRFDRERFLRACGV